MHTKQLSSDERRKIVTTVVAEWMGIMPGDVRDWMVCSVEMVVAVSRALAEAMGLTSNFITLKEMTVAELIGN